jgi:DNA-binding CsgD family transcriptional regulator
MLISRQPPRRPLQLVATPFYSSEIVLDERPAALIVLTDPDARPTSRESVLRALYELTPAECRMAGLLAAGFTIANAANSMNVSTLTARTQLKAIFRKTGTNRQAELVRLVLGLPGESKPSA